jgi:hypothetical protein
MVLKYEQSLKDKALKEKEKADRDAKSAAAASTFLTLAPEVGTPSQSAPAYSSTRGLHPEQSTSSSKLRGVYFSENYTYYVPEKMIKANLKGSYSQNGDFQIYLYEEFNQDSFRQSVIGDIKSELANGTALRPHNSPGDPDHFKYQVLNIYVQQGTKMVSLKETLYIDAIGAIIGTKPANDTFILDTKKYQTLSNAIHGVMGILEEAKNGQGINDRSQTPPNNPYPPRQGEPRAKPTAAEIVEQLRSRGN